MKVLIVTKLYYFRWYLDHPITWGSLVKILHKAPGITETSLNAIKSLDVRKRKDLFDIYSEFIVSI